MFDLAAQLAERKDAGLFRRRLTASSPQGVNVVIDGREYLSFCSNDYLGLASHPDLVRVLQEAAGKWGTGAGASHLLGGHSEPHEELERVAARCIGADRALLFSTGYMANLAVMSALAGRGDLIHQDRLNHASLIDGALLSRAALKRYRHRDTAQLASHLADAAGNSHRRQLIASDGVFSMDGDLAPLQTMLSLARQHQALCYIDDAHGFGVIGEKGKGIVEQAAGDGSDFSDGQLLLMCTLGKAMGSFGAFVAGSGELIETLVQSGRSYIYTTALPPAQAAVSVAAIELIEKEAWRRSKLASLVSYFKTGCRQRDIPLMDSATPIQPVMIGSNERAMRIAGQLNDQGLLVFAIRSPTVAAGSERIRITLSAEHDEAAIGRLLDGLANALHDTGGSA
jgi:8-amino-7-oxononanoate synthase